MSMINGGLTQGRRIPTMSHAEFVDHFLAHVTSSEREVLRQFPAAMTPGQLVCMVILIRELRGRELPPGHPLAALKATPA